MPMKDDYRNPFWGDRKARPSRRWTWLAGVLGCLAIGSVIVRFF